MSLPYVAQETSRSCHCKLQTWKHFWLLPTSRHFYAVVAKFNFERHNIRYCWHCVCVDELERALTRSG
jgi:hypothetical protein